MHGKIRQEYRTNNRHKNQQYSNNFGQKKYFNNIFIKYLKIFCDDVSNFCENFLNILLCGIRFFYFFLLIIIN